MTKLFGYPLAFLRFLIIILIMVVFIVGYLLSTIVKKSTPQRAFNLRRNYLRLALPVLNVKYEVKGNPHDAPALYVSNHRTFFDPAVICLFLDAYVIAKAEIANYPIINKGAELTGVIWVKRESLISRKNTREALVNGLKEGKNILVYPEGTTNNEKKVLPFKKGTFHEIAKLNIPAVPIALEYQDKRDFWKGGSLAAQYFKQFSKWRTHIKMEFGMPVTSKEGQEINERCEQWINDKLSEMHVGWSTAFPS